MLRGTKQTIAQTATRRSVHLILFSVGGKSFAIKADEVLGVEPWPTSMPIPSTTPFVTELVRRNKIINPVYDLAGQWALEVEETTASLCVLVKWNVEEVVLRVDSEIPSLESTDADMIRPSSDRRPETIGTWTYHGVDVPVVSFLHMRRSDKRAA